MTFKRLLVGAVLLVSPGMVHAETAASWIAQGDALYVERGEPARDRDALADYEKAIALESSSVEANWKASRAAWWLGTRLEDRSERLKAFDQGKVFGERAVQLAPDSAPAHFWLGGNYSSFNYVKGAFSSLVGIKKVRSEMNDVLRLDAPYMGGGANRILGILDYKVPGIMGGSKSRGLQNLQKALTYDSQNPLTIFYLADYYASVGEKEKAKEYLARLSELKPSSDFLVELDMMKREAKTLSAKL